MKGESQEELNARVLKVTTENWKAPYIVKDTDCQLKYLLAILNEMHERFFSQVILYHTIFFYECIVSDCLGVRYMF
jgi:hypothetical protein